MNNYSKFGVTKDFWESLSEEEKALFNKINPFLKEEDLFYTVKASQLNTEIERLKEEATSRGGFFELNPIYQRDNSKWNKKQKIAYIENLVRNIAPVEFKFNRNKSEEMTCIDGLQRITAILDFINGEFLVFGDMDLLALSKTRFSLSRRNLVFKLYSFQENIDLYHFYLKLNEGGTQHSKVDIDKVKRLIDLEERERGINI